MTDAVKVGFVPFSAARANSRVFLRQTLAISAPQGRCWVRRSVCQAAAEPINSKQKRAALDFGAGGA